jgi:hypothetical protein
MSSRLIPCLLAATGFIVALTVVPSTFLGWRGSRESSYPPQEVAQPSAVVRRQALQPIEQDQRAESSPAYSAPEAAHNIPPQPAPQPVLPLPSTAQVDPPRDVLPVRDDEPTVDDLAGRQTLSPDASAEPP